MDWDIQSTSVVIIGAGFSAAATDGKLPLMTGFFDRLRSDDFPDLYSFVRDVGCNKVCERIEDANVERVLVAFEQMRNSPRRILQGLIAQRRTNLDTIQMQLSLYTLARLRDGLAISPDNWAVQLLAACGPNTTVISMNYDNIVERVLSNRPGTRHGSHSPCPHCRMRQLLQHACSCESKSDILDDSWRGAVIKPHGSIAWRRCLNAECCSYQCLVADEQCRPFVPCNCPTCDDECSPVIVMPTMSKNLNEIPEIDTMWRAARLALVDAESILLFGFSLPTSDELLVQLIRSACAEGGKLSHVASIDLEPEYVLRRFEWCLPPGFNIEPAAFPVQKGEIPIWFAPKSPGILAGGTI